MIFSALGQQVTNRDSTSVLKNNSLTISVLFHLVIDLTKAQVCNLYITYLRNKMAPLRESGYE